MQLRSTWLILLTASLLYSEEPPASKLLQASRADLDAGNYAQAIEGADRCADAFRKSGDAKNLGAALRVLGLARLYSGSYTSAVDNLKEALGLARQLHDFGSEISRLNDLGMASYLQGSYRGALDRYDEAQALIKESPNDKWAPWARQVTTANIAILYQTLGQYDRALSLYSGLLDTSGVLEPAEQAQLLSNVGALRRRLGDPVKALETYRKAQMLYARTKHADGEILVLNNIGIVQAMDLGDTRAADASFSKALALAKRSGDRPLAIEARLNRGEARFRASQFQLSHLDLALAADLAHQLGQSTQEWKALYGLAREAVSHGQIDAARDLLLRAVQLIENLRDKAGSNNLRSTFLADKRAVYDLLIETSPTPADSFQWMEHSRARTLLDQTESRGVTKSLHEFQRTLPRDTAVLEFWMGSKAAAVLWISASDAGVKRFVPDLPTLARMRQVLADAHRSDWRGTLQPLAQQLLGGIPVLADANINRLRIIPDGPLALLPFEALPIGQSSELLIQRYSVSYAPSAGLSHSSKAPAPRFRWPWQPSLAGLADPEAGSGAGDGRAWTSLPHARAEANRVANIVGGKTEIYLGLDARKVNLIPASSYPIVHLATHAQADLQDPERSFILLAPSSPKTQQYDYLFSREVSAGSFAKTNLVTLSACETSVGVFVPGEGLRGFSEAFLAAGARSVLNSLWSVGDTSTEELMTRFYSRLGSGETAADALRGAKLEFLAHSQSSHPAHWAAFVLNGDGDWRLPRLIGWPWLVGLIFAIVAFAFWKMRGRLGDSEPQPSGSGPPL